MNARATLKRLLRRLLPSQGRPGIRVLMFHSFDGKGSASCTPAILKEMLTELASKGYKFLTLKEALARISEANAKNILITVDDATADLLEAMPIFQDLQVPVLLAAPCGISMLTTSEGDTRRVLGSTELQALVATGLVTLASHGVSHASFTELDATALEQELQESRRFLEATNPTDSPLVLVYPRGKNNAAIQAATKKAGFVAAFGVQPGVWDASTHLYAIPRYPIMQWMRATDVLDEVRGAADRLRQLF